MNDTTGIVDLVGAGPGDPGLLTLRGREVLSMAEVVVYDHLVHIRLLDIAPPGAERIFAGKRAGHCALHQSDINELLVRHARAGRRVVRLKGGDPFVFGRGAEEAEYLHATGIPFRVVPGVTAGVGATAYAGVPITHRDSASAVAFVTGHDDPRAADGRVDWKALASFPGTLVLYMGVGRLSAIRDVLVMHGKAPSTPAAFVRWGSLPRQQTLVATLGDLPERIAERGLGPPALVVIGDVALRRESLAWYERQPLFGQRILLTRPRSECERVASELEMLGAEVLIAPTVEIRAVEDTGPMDRAIESLVRFDWLVFTSGNGVRHFLDRLPSLGRDLRALGHLKLAAIGPTTAEALAQYQLRADLVPAAYRSEDLAAELSPLVAGRRVLLARADRGRPLLKEELERVAEVEQVPVYINADAESLPSEALSRLADGTIDWITLTSSAITERLHALIPTDSRAKIGRSIRLASLSPVTSAAAARLGWQVAVEASCYTWAGLLRALTAQVLSERSARSS